MHVWCCDVTSLCACAQVAGNLELNELPDVTPMDEFFNDGHHSDIVVIIAAVISHHGHPPLHTHVQTPIVLGISRCRTCAPVEKLSSVCKPRYELLIDSGFILCLNTGSHTTNNGVFCFSTQRHMSVWMITRLTLVSAAAPAASSKRSGFLWMMIVLRILQSLFVYLIYNMLILCFANIR